jgi:rare lipoprotein A
MKKHITIGLSLITIIILSSCATKTIKANRTNEIEKVSTSVYQYKEKRETIPAKQNFHKIMYGKASYYGAEFHGKKTASGEIYDMNAKTAAHRTLPFNTMVKVTDMKTHNSDIVRINDRGPYSSNRVIDLSYASAKKLGIIDRGVANVRIEIVGYNGQIDKKKSLPISTQACIGGKCRATSIKKNNNNSEDIKPFTILNQNAPKDEPTPIIQSVYDDDTLTNRLALLEEDDPYIEINQPTTYPKMRLSKEKTAIQVGAFRRYAGAKIYAKRYGVLSHRYKTVIKKYIKDSRPLYRVRIEGFKNEKEAKRFMSRYSLNGAFLVRK